MSAGSPSVAALRAEFGSAVSRHAVSCGDTIVYVERERAHDVLAWLKVTPGQEFNYLTDVTAVEYRDPERPLELVWQLRSLSRRADLRVKVGAGPARPARGAIGRRPVAGGGLAGARGLRHVRDHLHGAPRPAPDPDVGDLRRGVPAAEVVPVARALQPCGADPAGARRRSPRPTTRWKNCPSPTRSTSCPPTCGSGSRAASGDS